MNKNNAKNSIPIAPALEFTSDTLDNNIKNTKTRLIIISTLSVIVASVISIIAKGLVLLINLFTNISFFGIFNTHFHSPADNHLGIFVIAVPIIGGLLVGLMATYGSQAIRGHGIPEAMEQILTNKSNIHPKIAYLKPISSAIAIGTGGPFGAEGPIIATGGALGSTLGQLFKLTSNERKVVLAAGATAGMSAIFGTPIAAVFLAIELLLFEFSPKSILPIALACITGAAGHHLLFEDSAAFPMPDLGVPSNIALASYSLIGVIIGFLSMIITKILYLIEDLFEKLPLHWMLWPAIGGLFVGIIGYFFPHTLGVGYDNITNILSGKMTLQLMLCLFFFKFISWAIALGSGTSGGTLAPLLTIGGAAGAILTFILIHLFPNAELNIPMGALIGMSAMFAGASRAYLTSITFAIEATMQSHAILPLLGACTASYLISYFLMENTIMTEKIARRGIHTPTSFEPDLLQKINVSEVVNEESVVFNSADTINEIKAWLIKNKVNEDYVITLDGDGKYFGTVKLMDIFLTTMEGTMPISTIVLPGRQYVNQDENLRYAVELMSVQNAEILPVLSTQDNTVIGILSYRDILVSYRNYLNDNLNGTIFISLKRSGIRAMIKGKRLVRLKN